MDLEKRLPSHAMLEPSKFETIKTYFLTEEAVIMLTKTDFLDKVIFDTKYEDVGQFCKALAHLCYRNLSLSRKMCKKLIKAASWSSNEQI